MLVCASLAGADRGGFQRIFFFFLLRGCVSHCECLSRKYRLCCYGVEPKRKIQIERVDAYVLRNATCTVFTCLPPKYTCLRTFLCFLTYSNIDVHMYTSISTRAHQRTHTHGHIRTNYTYPPVHTYALTFSYTHIYRERERVKERKEREGWMK